jgi:hypothetical protein
MRSVRRFLAAFAVAALIASPAFAVTNERVDKVDAEFAHPMVDVLVMRPVGLIGLGLSSIIWVPAQVITMVVNPTEWYLPIHHLLAKPAKFVFSDPIGSH